MIQKQNRRGQALIELALLAPCAVFLFIAAANFGFCILETIGVQNAARAAALYTSSSASTASACSVVKNELQSLPNYNSNLDCSSAPLQVTAVQVNRYGNPAVQVTVTYQPLVPVPPLFPTFSIVRVAEIPMRPQ